MPGKIGKYTYKNEAVLNEFLGKLVKALAKRKASKVLKQLKTDPVLQKKMDDIDQKLIQIQKDRKNNPKVDALLTSLGM
tara:strand:- start:449 stop:685 length:237 start_codon:yes stop_codon:yes gene_type:complete